MDDERERCFEELTIGTIILHSSVMTVNEIVVLWAFGQKSRRHGIHNHE